MKKIMIRYSIFLLVAGVLFLTQTYTYAQNMETEATVEFMAGEGPTRPVYPEDPNIESNTDPVEGSLAIVSVSDFDFGIIPVMATTQLYDVQNNIPNIQVVDLRGSGAGWKVSASVSRFSDGENDSLPGAVIFIYNGRPNSLSTSPAPTQKQNVKLTTDGEAAPVITAAAGAGTGLWVMRWYPSADEGAYIQLEIPAGSATVGNHTATINWTLENAPS